MVTFWVPENTTFEHLHGEKNVTMQNVAVFQKKKLENHNILHGNMLHGNILHDKKFLRNLCYLLLLMEKMETRHIMYNKKLALGYLFLHVLRIF